MASRFNFTAVDQNSFGAFGESEGMNFAPSPLTSPVTYGFAGMMYDEESGLYASHGPRKYDPTIGRYTSQDPIGLRGGVNLFAYVGNNPLRFTDPFGTDIWLEGPAPGEPSGHLSISVGSPTGAYSSFSFGLTGPGLKGEVYQDTSAPGNLESGYYLVTNSGEDAAILAYLTSLVGQSSIYGLGNTCRDFAHSQFQAVQGAGIGQSAILPLNPIRGPDNPSSDVPFPFMSTVN